MCLGDWGKLMPSVSIWEAKMNLSYEIKCFAQLSAIYSLLEQLRLEHNRQGAIAKSDWAKYGSKWKAYTSIYRSKLKPLLHEQNLLREKIRKANYTDEEWRKLPVDEFDAVEKQLYGNKAQLGQLPTKATTPLIDELKQVNLDALAIPQALDPTQDLTTYSIYPDPLVYTTVTSARATIASLPRNVDEYVYADKGVNHFDGDFEHLLEAQAEP